MKIPCIRIHNSTKDGTNFRPGTPSPDKHWSGMLANSYSGSDNIQVAASHEEHGGPEVHICRDFHNENPGGFEHIMKFVSRFDLTASVDHAQCSSCDKNKHCIREDLEV